VIVRIQEQPFQILAVLLERPGEIATRGEIRKALWPGNEFGDFDHAINVAVKKLRDALRDKASNPRFVETVGRRGYRFIGSLHEEVQQASASAIRSIAVLPLQNLSSDPAQEYLADGVTDALITNLAKIGSLRVVSRTSVMQYKGVRKSLPVIADELKVDAMVEGSIQRHGDRLRIIVQLLEARNDRHLWADSYDCDFQDLLIVQSQVARDLSEHIKVKLTPQEQAQLAMRRCVNPKAYEAFLKAWYLMNKVTEEGFRKAIGFFQQAIEKDPGYAPAYAGLADAYTSLAVIGGAAPREVFPSAKAAALRALEIDSTVGEAHLSLALITWRYDWDWVSAEPQFKRAIELNPRDAVARRRYASYLYGSGRIDESLVQLMIAQTDDPLSAWISSNIGFALYFARRYDDAIKQLHHTLEIEPHFALGHCFLGLALEQKTMFAEAAAEFRKGISLSGGKPVYLAALAHAYALSGRETEARDVLEELEMHSKHTYFPAYEIAVIYTGLREPEQAFAWLERAYEERGGWIGYFKVDPRLDSLRSDARFRTLLRRIGLPE
jgi:TolB-like protein/Tfp pilus assembly protein PilF